MGDHLTLERYYWFDNQVRKNRHPNAHSLAEQFEVSSKTAQRGIDFMRDRLGAPLEYHPSRRGYRYLDESYALPSFQVSQEEMVSILIARDLLSHSAGGLISRTIQSFGRKLFVTMGHIGFSGEKLDRAFSAVWNGYSPSQADTFKTVLNALLQNRLLACRYASPASGQETERTIEPHHLQHYMGSWVLIGWCHLRNEWRKFFLSRMSDPVLTGGSFEPRPKTEWEPLIHAGFGIFQGNESVRTRMKDLVPVERIVNWIYLIRDKKVMMDRDLAELYGVETAQLKRAVKRNIERFPPDFMFELTKQELEDWRCQFGTSNGVKMGLRHLPIVFTEQGVAMLSSVLRSRRAISVNIQIMRAFTQLRQMLSTHEDLKRKIEAMESKYDQQFKIVFEAIKRLLDSEERPKRRIGFEVKEAKAAYGKGAKKK